MNLRIAIVSAFLLMLAACAVCFKAALHYKEQVSTLDHDKNTLNEELITEREMHETTKLNLKLITEILENANAERLAATKAAADSRAKLKAALANQPCAITAMPSDAFNILRQAAINANVRAGISTDANPTANTSTNPGKP